MRFTFCAESRECEKWLRRYAEVRRTNGFAPWTIELRAEQRVIGWSGLNIDPGDPGWRPEVSYFIHPAYQGRGLATELVRCSLHYGFNGLRLPAIGAFAMPENAASNKVLRKCGFRLVRYEPRLSRNHYKLEAEDWVALIGD